MFDFGHFIDFKLGESCYRGISLGGVHDAEAEIEWYAETWGGGVDRSGGDAAVGGEVVVWLACDDTHQVRG